MNSVENSQQTQAETLNVSVWRGSGDAGQFQHFSVPRRDNQTVLDVVSWIQQHADANLSYRFACRVGMCGSCAMMVNNQPRWTCRTHVSLVATDNSLEIAPLRNLPVIKDLVTDMSVFFDKWVNAEGVFQPTQSRHDAFAVVKPDSRMRQHADAGIECINCAVCYAACDTVAANPSYLGPAALTRAWTLQNDTRDAATEQRWDAISGPGGCHNCHTHQSCVQYCPKQLNPAKAIAGLKRGTLKKWLAERFKP